MSQAIWKIIADKNLQNQSAAEIHATITAKSIVVRTTYFLTCNQVNLLLPFDQARAFAATLANLAAADPWFARLQDTLCGVGVDLSLEKSQDLLDQFAAAKFFDAELIAMLKSLGVKQLSLLEQAGITDEVTVDEVQKIVSTRAAIMALRDRSNAIKEQVDAIYSAWEQGQSVVVPTFEDLVG